MSQKTKGSVLKAEWDIDRPSQAGRLRIQPVFDGTKQDKDRTGQGRTGQDRADILVDHTRVSTLPICPIIQHTFV